MPLSPESHLYTVSQLNRETKRLLNEHFYAIRVEGEISNLSAPSSGHLYFSLKDSAAQIRCAMFKSQLRRIGFKPRNGIQVVATAQVTLYEPRGDYQLVVESLEETGDGALRMAFERLKHQLSEEGLFDTAHKKPILALPNCIGVVTSPTGAAIRDILIVLKRRFPSVPVIVYPVAVQGENAASEIARALSIANTFAVCDVLILARGGGSLEDLQAFNEESVARAIYKSGIPVITGIGHEVDITIADYVSDLRAATPSAAAEHAVPDQREWLDRFEKLELKLAQRLSRQLAQKTQLLQWLDKRLQQLHPGQRLYSNAQRLDELEMRLTRTMQRNIEKACLSLNLHETRFYRGSPEQRISVLSLRLTHLARRLHTALNSKMAFSKQRLNQASQSLHAVSPLATLSRGYAVVTCPDSGEIIRTAKQLHPQTLVTTRLGQGLFTSRVEEIFEEF